MADRKKSKKISMRLVIDSSVMQSSGHDHQCDERPRLCRDFLFAVLRSNHRVVVSDQIISEWRSHSSEIAISWQVQMRSQNRCWDVTPAENAELRRKLDALEIKKCKLKVMRDDLLLVEAAIITDRIIFSLDDEARDLYCQACCLIEQLRRIMWVNLESKEEDGTGWLEKGLHISDERTLEFRANGGGRVRQRKKP